MNNRTAWVGKQYKSGILTNALLTLTVLFFGYVAYLEIVG